MAHQTLTQVDSINLAAVAWKDGTLVVEFKSGEIYRYEDVLETEYLLLLAAGSKGKFFISRIRNQYRTSKITATELDALFGVEASVAARQNAKGKRTAKASQKQWERIALIHPEFALFF